MPKTFFAAAFLKILKNIDQHRNATNSLLTAN